MTKPLAHRQLLRKLGFLNIFRPLNGYVRRLSAMTHKWQHDLEWGVDPSPEWYDTFMGQHYSWHDSRITWVWDRGVFSAFAMRPDARVLDLCCGGGFFTYHFYAGRAAKVTGADFDPRAIEHARRYNKAPNVEYVIADIRKELPPGEFDHIVWDAAIEHFTPDEINAVIRAMRKQMSPSAILSGYTIQVRADGAAQHSDHEYEFLSKEDLARFIAPHF